MSSLDQTVASLLFGIKPLSEPMQTCFQLNHKENVSMKYHLKYKIFSQKMYLNMPSEMATILSQQKCVLMIVFSVDWKVSIKASETYMVYLWVTIGQCIVVIILNFTGQLIHKLKNLETSSLVLVNDVHFTKYGVNSRCHHYETICCKWQKYLHKTPSNRITLHTQNAPKLSKSSIRMHLYCENCGYPILDYTSPLINNAYSIANDVIHTL